MLRQGACVMEVPVVCLRLGEEGLHRVGPLHRIHIMIAGDEK
ncbi:unknown [Firmicutes bacterium CAG:137]|nr:unknown [Firmicutes bacterium CAG:137]